KSHSLAIAPIQIFKHQENYVEQSSEDIWENTCSVVKKAVKEAGIKPEAVKGIGFDATCSLVALRDDYKPVSVSLTKNDQQNIIVWMDHRAIQEAEEINATGNEVLCYVGGKISPEMELPKLVWLKRHLPDQFKKTKKFLDLADFLVYRCTGTDIRSVCTKVCKWTYLAHEKRWNKHLFTQFDVDDLFADNRIGGEIRDIGQPAGQLSTQAADEMGLTTDTIVAVGIIDAHAGGVGIIGNEPEQTLAIIGGTSSCHMAVNKKPIFVDGVWGPYFGAMLPGYWLNEGGQSAAGALIDHVIQDSAYYPELKQDAEKSGTDVYQILNENIRQLERENTYLTEDFHLLGYYHGNRSPRANPNLRGMISGLTLNTTLNELSKHYLAAIQSVAYGTRHIIQEMNKSGYSLTKIHMCGGGTKNDIWLREHADITGCEVVLPREPEAVLLGSAILAAAASNGYPDMMTAIREMTAIGEKISPRIETADYHERKYKIFNEMYHDQMKYKKIMATNT
ncbi:hypothetical protein GF337_00070, partial [candidate division KSB1 bacterium]|nr:hypothetical protein [candidate division KSB1 bacterium]